MADVKKYTKRMAIEEMLADEAIQAHEEWVKYLKNELALLDKKHGGSKKVNEANESLKTIIVEVLAKGDGTISQLQGKDDRLLTTKDGTRISNQKMSAMMRQLITEGKVEKYKDKKNTIFTLA